MDEQSELRLELKRDFTEFLDQDFGRETGSGRYVKRVDDIIKAYPQTNRVRLEVDLQDLSDYNEELHRRVLSSPSTCLPPFEEALEEFIRNRSPKLLEETQRVHVALTGEFGPNTVSPRNLTSEYLSKLVSLQGIVTRCTLVRPKIVKSVHWCPATGQFSSREYRDVTSNSGVPTTTAYPTKDETDNLLITQYGLSTYIDHQTVTIQELPETAPPGQLPRSVEVILEDDLRDACKPGDRVAIAGIYKPIAPRANGAINGVFRAVVVANGVRKLSRDAQDPVFTEEDYDNITELAGEGDLMDQLGQSLAPSIHGYATIKKALVLLLAGGRERDLVNGTHLRGDINCLMVGDPGVAKSQLLRAVMNIAPLCISTTGRGSSGVGLTAAVTMDQDTGERRLEAGAMVLADRGVVCIDEFDKMNDGDRVAIHEVMEQQTVTIAKAGILTSLNARCSVVAAANPIYGHYDRTISITRNIGLPDSLLSRFDLLFVVLDNNDAARDREIADHVLGQHRYRAPGDDGKNGGDDRYVENLEEDEERERGVTPVYVKYDARLYGPRRPGQKEPLSLPFLKKYIAFAKQRFAAPELTPEASDAIAEYYADLRNSQEVKALPVTVRTLETLIRLSCAHAKVRLSAAVERSDVEEVQTLVDFILKSDPSAEYTRRPSSKREGGAKRDRGAEGSESEDDGGDGGAPSAGRRARGAAAADADAAAPMETDDAVAAAAEAADEPISDAEEEAPAAAEQGSLTEDAAAAVRRAVTEVGQHGDACSLTGVKAVLAAQGVHLSSDEILSVLSDLHAAEVIMLDGTEFYLSV
ncbi:DNA replication licensing factor MCM3 [Micractinium conductrix]|uniref:DNA replication licensing factor MCM3 n=1 Tax=Micractinium conductrix TaxID=554055 RepID=A0A2P6V9W9_9CHLO|nr:DNA replication licensing factor MCM3 [Micractinium conductrix]|eukprot:PSC70868.1 DNA replication licensing factor MCM3 [Micractinium conductrix]